MADELNIPVIALAQLNRTGDGEDPALIHLKDSGSIEESADLVFLLHELKNEAEHEGKLRKYILNLAKQRNGVSDYTSKIRIDYLAWKTLFIDPKLDNSTLH
jgi:replicative DNA helicase